MMLSSVAVLKNESLLPGDVVWECVHSLPLHPGPRSPPHVQV